MPAISISNAVIDEISSERGTTFVTATYQNVQNRQRPQQTVRLVVRPSTVILNTNGIPIPASMLRTGMTINAVISSAMTRSIPPQATAYVIKVTSRQLPESTTTGNILSIDRDNRSFTTIRDQDTSSIIRFNVPKNVMIFNRNGTPVGFHALRTGMRVRVRHANFMTASIPPQTTAFEIRIL